MRNFLTRMTLLLLCAFVLLWGRPHVSFADSMTETEAFFSAPEGYSGMVDVPGAGPVRYYAQNDPLWMLLAYEYSDTQSRRPFRDSGCSPAAVAMAVARLVPEEQLRAISNYAKRDYSLCECSVNRSRCTKKHIRYILTSDRDFTRFLPLVFGDFAAGNNTFGTISRSVAAGTGTGYVWDIARVYGLSVSFTPDFQQALSALKSGAAVVGLASAGGAFTNTGHYVFLASADEEKTYILDPLRREAYKTNQGGRLEIIRPGLVALAHEQVAAAQFSNFILFTKEDPVSP